MINSSFEVSLPCSRCIYRHDGNRELTCEAFPKGIPLKIRSQGGRLHSVQIQGQKGEFVFKPVKDFEKESIDRITLINSWISNIDFLKEQFVSLFWEKIEDNTEVHKLNGKWSRVILEKDFVFTGNHSHYRLDFILLDRDFSIFFSNQEKMGQIALKILTAECFKNHHLSMRLTIFKDRLFKYEFFKDSILEELSKLSIEELEEEMLERKQEKLLGGWKELSQLKLEKMVSEFIKKENNFNPIDDMEIRNKILEQGYFVFLNEIILARTRLNIPTYGKRKIRTDSQSISK